MPTSKQKRWIQATRRRHAGAVEIFSPTRSRPATTSQWSAVLYATTFAGPRETDRTAAIRNRAFRTTALSSRQCNDGSKCRTHYEDGYTEADQGRAELLLPVRQTSLIDDRSLGNFPPELVHTVPQ